MFAIARPLVVVFSYHPNYDPVYWVAEMPHNPTVNHDVIDICCSTLLQKTDLLGATLVSSGVLSPFVVNIPIKYLRDAIRVKSL